MTFNFRETNRLPEIPKELKLSIEAQRFPWKFTSQSTTTTKAVKRQSYADSQIVKMDYYLNNIYYDSFETKPLLVKDKKVDTSKIVTYKGTAHSRAVILQLETAREIVERINQALKPKNDSNYKDLSGTIHIDEYGYVTFNFKIIKTLNDLNKKLPEKFPEDWKLIGAVLLGENESRINTMGLASIGQLGIWIGYNLLKIWDEEQYKKKIFLYGHGPTMKPKVLDKIKENIDKVQKVQMDQSELTYNCNKQGSMISQDGGGRWAGCGYD